MRDARFKTLISKPMLYLLFTVVIFVYDTPLIHSQPVQIHSFDELLLSLDSGEKVRAIVHYGRCKLYINETEQSVSPDAVAGMDIDTFEYFPAGVAGNKLPIIVFSESKLINNPTGKGYVYNYGKFKIYSDNSVEITARYLRPGNQKVIMDELFKGIIDNGSNGGGIKLFR